MESEIIETVLKDILEDLKYSNGLNKENQIRLISIEKNLGSKDVTKPEINTKPIEQIISTGMNNIRAIIDRPPEKRRHEFRVLFFPEDNSKEYYKIVYGRIIFWLVMLVIAKYLYLLGSEWISKTNDDQRYKKAWENLYQQQGKPSQKMMQKMIDSE